MLAGVAHELNNPLTIVVGRSAILEEQLGGTPYAKAITGLREAADRCSRIVRTFLAMARQSAPRRGRVRVNSALEAALDMTTYGIRAAGIELVRELSDKLPEVEADEDQLVQVITNLLLNAQHALETHEGGRRIRVTTAASGDRVDIEIADNGPGVAQDLELRIFEPFFTTKDVGQGTGIGLAMARGIVEEHGGALTLAQTPGGGASFRISLPAARGPDAPATTGSDAERPTKARGRVLVIDDEAPIREMLVEILAAGDLECVQAADGSAALELLLRERFDLVFCDVRMPVMDGVRLRRRLAQARPELLERLVFMSGDVLHGAEDRHAEIRDHLFISKPFEPAEVRRAVQAALGVPDPPPRP